MSETTHNSFEEIVVEGRRQPASDFGSISPMRVTLPSLWAAAPIVQQTNPFSNLPGPEVPTFARIYTTPNGKVIKVEPFGFTFNISTETWNNMSLESRAAIMHVLSNYKDSPKLTEALYHLSNEGVQQIKIHFGSSALNIDGNPVAFKIRPDGSPAPAQIAYENSPADPTMRDITNPIITISFNIGNYPEINQSHNIQFVGKTFMHELLHPVTSDNVSSGDDHLAIEAAVAAEFGSIWNPNGASFNINNYSGQISFLGSRYSDIQSGGSGADVLAGMGGNDNLNGAGGDDLVTGGVGMDVLSGGTGNNLLAGGLDADTYVTAVGGEYSVITEDGGVDTLDLSHSSLSNAIFSRQGDTLLVSVANGTNAYEIDLQFLSSSKVEQFAFADGTYAASYIEYLANGSGGTGVCYDGSGNPIICGSYGLPVVFDLDGDGIELVGLSKSKARFDIDGDGTAERIGWVGKDDGILVLDRNGNGRIDDFSEMSFLSDFRGAGSDLEGLMAYDGNRDGRLDASDGRFGEFRVWVDGNGNGR